MSSILVISNTYYQLITAIRLKQTHWKNESVDIVISDQSRNSEMVAIKLKEIGFFDSVLWIKSKKICQDTRKIYLKIKRWKYVIHGVSYHHITDKRYDEIVYYNPDVITYGIFAMLIKKNKNLVCSRYEEGILSYRDSEYLNNSRLKYANIIRKLLHKNLLEERTSDFYCFYPELYSGKLNPIAIPQIEYYEKMGLILKKIFDINNEMLDINEKYIFFTGVFDFEGEATIGEFDLVLKVAELVGKENLIVKTHPRDTRRIYEENGIHVYKNSSIPWEAIQLNCDFSDKIFLTVNSGSILGVNMMLKNRTKSFFLYNCCDIKNNIQAVRYIEIIQQFISNFKSILYKIEVIESSERIREICNPEQRL